MEEIKHSPIPRSPILSIGMSFPKAMEEIIEGKAITKLEWNNENIYGILRNGFLILHKDNKDGQWVISEGDLMGKDYIVIDLPLVKLN